MKLLRTVAVIIFVIAVFAGGQSALAAEQWGTDPDNGSRVCIVFFADDITLTAVSWSGPAVNGLAEGQGKLRFAYRGKDGKEISVQGDAEMKGGKMDGKASIKWSDGDSYDGVYQGGMRNGQGTFRYASGRVYEGDWKNGVPHGYGVGRDATGKVVHDGEWKDGNPLIPLKADKVLGIPWGASEEQARSIMLQRPNTKAYSFMNGNDAHSQWKGYFGPFADFSDAEIWVHFYQGKMWQVQISWALKDDQVMDRFTAVKRGLTERYGAPASETGKYLDAVAVWDLGGGYYVNVQIRKNTVKYIAGTDPALTHPFRVYITYHNQAVADIIEKAAKPAGAHKDY